MALAPGNVQSQLITGVALSALGTFTGAGVGMRKKTVLTEEPIEVEMNSENPWHDLSKFTIPLALLQNDFATLATLHTYAGAGCQAYVRTPLFWMPFTAADWDVETALGLDWKYNFDLDHELTTNVTLMTEVARATAKGLYSTTDPVGVTWTSGEDGTKRLRPGVKKLTIAGTHAGELRSVAGTVANIPSVGRKGRTLSRGVMADINTIGTQMAKADVDAIHDATSANDTLIWEFDNGQTIKLTNLFGGKRAKFNVTDDGTWELLVKASFPDTSATVKINTSPNVLELVYLDNAAEA